MHGRRARNDLRTNINALIDAQMRNEELFSERFARLFAAQDRTDEQIKELLAAQMELTASQKLTDEKLRILIDIVGLDRNGANS